MINKWTGADIELTKEMLLNALITIRDNEGFRNHDTGICGAVNCACIAQYECFTSLDDADNLRQLFSKWEHWSGDYYYPIQTGKRSASKQYHDCMDMWNQKKKYGKARWQLLHWTIQQLTDEVQHAVKPV